MTKGEIILIPFPFTDLSGSKLRPALVLIESLTDLTVSFITTRFKRQELTDLDILPSHDNGLKKKSLLRLSKIATIDKKLAIGKLGVIDAFQMTKLNDNLKILLLLP